MRTFLAAAAFLAVSTAALGDLGDAGPFPGGFRQVTVNRPPDQGGGSFTARLFYPAASAGQNTPIDPSGGPYPAVSFGHGFLQAVSTYQSTLLHLATHGFLVIATDSEGGFFPNHSNFARDILVSLTYLEQQNADEQSDLFGLVDTGSFGVSGHSMGGGACILAAAQDQQRIKAVAPLSAANTNPSSIAASVNIRAATRHIVGSQDTIVPPATSRQMFDATPVSRQFITLVGGFHCGFIDSQTFGCDSGSMSRADQLRYVRRQLTEFFALHLKRDQSLWPAVWSPFEPEDPRVQIERRPEIDLAPGEIELSLRAGDAASIPVPLRNVGVVETAAALLLDGAPAWAAVDPSTTAPLAPGAEFIAGLELNPPQGTPAGEFSFLLSARVERDGATRDVARISLRITCPADFNGNGQADFFDYLDFVQAFADESPDADFNGDGQVDFFDYLDFVAAFAEGCA